MVVRVGLQQSPSRATLGVSSWLFDEMTRKSSDVLGSWEDFGGRTLGGCKVQGCGRKRTGFDWTAVTLRSNYPPGVVRTRPPRRLAAGKGEKLTETTNVWLTGYRKGNTNRRKWTTVGGDNSALRRCSAVILGAAAHASCGPAFRALRGRGGSFGGGRAVRLLAVVDSEGAGCIVLTVRESEPRSGFFYRT